jgi:hypothetical protein
VLIELERQMRVAIRDAVNRESRKPFYWGGLKGYQQLQAIAEGLQRVPSGEPETGYLHRLAMQVNRAIERNRVLAQDLQEAHTWLRHIAQCLRYPPSSYSNAHVSESPLSSQQVKQEMKALLDEFQPDLKCRPAQAALFNTWHRVWEDSGPEWLHCYDIPGLPQDNLALEALFGRLRNHQRRISGRQSTRELRDFGQFQILFLAESESELLQQLREVPLDEYQVRRRRLAQAEAPRQFLRRLHRNPLRTIRDLVDRHAARRAELVSNPQCLRKEPDKVRSLACNPALTSPSAPFCPSLALQTGDLNGVLGPVGAIRTLTKPVLSCPTDRNGAVADQVHPVSYPSAVKQRMLVSDD